MWQSSYICDMRQKRVVEFENYSGEWLGMGGRHRPHKLNEDKEKWDSNKVGKGMQTNGSILKFYKGKVNFGYSTQFESKDEGKITRSNEKSII